MTKTNLPNLFNFILYLLALALCTYMGYHTGVIQERHKWQNIYVCQYDPMTGAQVCMQDGPVIIQFNPKQLKDLQEHK